MGSVVHLLIMLGALVLSLLLSASVQGHGEQVHVSGSTGPTVVASSYPYYSAYAPYSSYPAYAPYSYPAYAPYSYYPARYGYSEGYVPAASTHGYENVNHATGTPYMYSRYPADIHYGERPASSDYTHTPVYPYAYVPYPYYPARYGYSDGYVPAASTHGYGNVNYATGPPYMHSRYPADISYGERLASSDYTHPPVYPYVYAPYSYYPARYGYSDAYVPAASTHGYGNVNYATGTPYIYSRYPADIPYGERPASSDYTHTPVYL